MWEAFEPQSINGAVKLPHLYSTICLCPKIIDSSFYIYYKKCINEREIILFLLNYIFIRYYT